MSTSMTANMKKRLLSVLEKVKKEETKTIFNQQ